MARTLLAILLVSLVFLTPAQADREADCQMLVENAVAFVREKGMDYAVKVFSARKSPFIDGEMYIFAVSMDNVMLAHPYKPDLIGKNQNDAVDAKGQKMYEAFKQVAEKNGSGWVEYWGDKPGEKGEFARRCFIKKIPNENVYVGAGFFK
jgi:signal transduction histidine kinase